MPVQHITGTSIKGVKLPCFKRREEVKNRTMLVMGKWIQRGGEPSVPPHQQIGEGEEEPLVDV
jgi:hypothetical protein